MKPLTELPWAEFPEGLRRDVDQYLQGLTASSEEAERAASGRPLKQSTIRARRVELAAAARMSVKTGVAIGDLNSLSALLAPEVVEKRTPSACRSMPPPCTVRVVPRPGPTPKAADM